MKRTGSQEVFKNKKLNTQKFSYEVPTGEWSGDAKVLELILISPKVLVYRYWNLQQETWVTRFIPVILGRVLVLMFILLQVIQAVGLGEQQLFTKLVITS